MTVLGPWKFTVRSRILLLNAGIHFRSVIIPSFPYTLVSRKGIWQQSFIMALSWLCSRLDTFLLVRETEPCLCTTCIQPLVGKKFVWKSCRPCFRISWNPLWKLPVPVYTGRILWVCCIREDFLATKPMTDNRTVMQCCGSKNDGSWILNFLPDNFVAASSPGR
jgi:hypothetical protein